MEPEPMQLRHLALSIFAFGFPYQAIRQYACTSTRAVGLIIPNEYEKARQSLETSLHYQSETVFHSRKLQISHLVNDFPVICGLLEFCLTGRERLPHAWNAYGKLDLAITYAISEKSLLFRKCRLQQQKRSKREVIATNGSRCHPCWSRKISHKTRQ